VAPLAGAPCGGPAAGPGLPGLAPFKNSPRPFNKKIIFLKKGSKKFPTLTNFIARQKNNILKSKQGGHEHVAVYF
jgi:hypothetical protein